MDHRTRAQLIQQHLDEIARLQAPPESGPSESSTHSAATTWPPRGYYMLFHLVIGMMLGFIGAVVSLMFNVAGAVLMGLPPLKLIQVYLTFPMGAEALRLDARADSGLILFVGVCLYLITGSIYGAAFHVVMSKWLPDAPAAKRFMVASALGLGLWVVNFYGVLSWLQPVLLGDAYIVKNVPIWVGALTHLVFAWTMLCVSFWGRFEHEAVAK